MKRSVTFRKRSFGIDRTGKTPKLKRLRVRRESSLGFSSLPEHNVSTPRKAKSPKVRSSKKKKMGMKALAPRVLINGTQAKKDEKSPASKVGKKKGAPSATMEPMPLSPRVLINGPILKLKRLFQRALYSVGKTLFGFWQDEKIQADQEFKSRGLMGPPITIDETFEGDDIEIVEEIPPAKKRASPMKRKLAETSPCVANEPKQKRFEIEEGEILDDDSDNVLAVVERSASPELRVIEEKRAPSKVKKMIRAVKHGVKGAFRKKPPNNVWVPPFNPSMPPPRLNPHFNPNFNFTSTISTMEPRVYQFNADKPLYPHMGVRKLSDNKLMAVNQPEQSRPPLTRRQSSGTGNMMVPETNVQKTGLRPIVIDGTNVAIAHGRQIRPGGHQVFSSRGIDLCVEYFLRRGHKDIIVFVPQYRQKSGQAMDRQILEKLSNKGILSFTPCHKKGHKTSTSYDDRYVVQYAGAHGGVIVSNDYFRDLLHESAEGKEAIEKRLLKFNFVKDTLMFPRDPLGKDGPTLDDFLKF